MWHTNSWTNSGSELQGLGLRCGTVVCANLWSGMRSISLCFEMLSRLSTGRSRTAPALSCAATKKRSSQNGLLHRFPDHGLICGFCPIAMPSAASQLISLDLFSSGRRNSFDLASSCFGFFTLLVGFDLLDLLLLLGWSSCGVSIQ